MLMGGIDPIIGILGIWGMLIVLAEVAEEAVLPHPEE